MKFMALRSKNIHAPYSIWLKNLAIINLIIFTFLFSSCSDDNPVKTNNSTIPLDSPRYHWKVDTIYYFIRYIWAPDTNDVYYLSPNDLIHYNSNKYSYIHLPYISARRIGGVDKNYFFIGGQDFSTHKAKMLKYNGSSFEEFLLGNAGNSNSYICSQIVLGSSNVWMGSYDGFIYHYTDSGITQYYLDSLYYAGGFFQDVSKNLYIHFENRGSPNPNPADSMEIMKIFKFSNGNWNMIDSSAQHVGGESKIPRNTTSLDVLALQYDGFYKYNFPGYSKAISINGFGIDILWSGISTNNVASPGSYNPNTNGFFTIFTWNGISWSDEEIKYETSYLWVESTNVQGKYYFSIGDWSLNFNTLICSSTKIK